MRQNKPMSLVEKIKHLRKLRDESQDAFAQAVGRSRATIAAWESGRKKPGRDALLRISRVCKVSIDYLTDEDAEKSQNIETETLLNLYFAADDATKAAVMHILSMSNKQQKS